MVTNSKPSNAPTASCLADVVVNYFKGFGVNEYTYPDDFVGQFDASAREVFSEIVDRGRWEAYLFTVFEMSDGSFVGVCHSEGLTENQDNEGVTDVYRAYPHDVTITTYGREA